MILLEETNIGMPKAFGACKAISQDEIEKHKKAKRDFTGRLNTSLRGKELVREIFYLIDHLTAEYLKNHEISCRAGCSYCCRQLVFCTTLEMELIVDYLNSIPKARKRAVLHKAKAKAHKFYQKNSEQLRNTSNWEHLAGFLSSTFRGVPCIFLKDGKCSIYPVRPIDCRIAKTADACGFKKIMEVEPQSLRLFCDQVASDLIMEEEERCSGAMQVVPLIGWLISEQFRESF